MATPDVPDLARVLALPAYFDQPVKESDIDENGHMNISVYFSYGAWAPWKRLTEIGLGERYIQERGLTFFTVEHHIRYLGELRLGERYSVHPGFAARTGKALHGISFVVDRERERIACAMEILYVHVDLATRRSSVIPDDVAGGLDVEIATAPWVADVATGLSLRR